MIGPIAALESVLFNGFTFSGRASRAEYWWFVLFYTLAMIAALFMDTLQVIAADVPSLNPFSYTSIWLSLLTLIPMLSVTVRRLHDSGRSGFWYLLFLVPVVGGIIMIVLMVAPSEQDDNIYGPPPRARLRTTSPKATRGGGGKAQKRDPMQAYAILDRRDEKPTAEMQAARREEIKEYYKTRVASRA